MKYATIASVGLLLSSVSPIAQADAPAPAFDPIGAISQPNDPHDSAFVPMRHDGAAWTIEGPAPDGFHPITLSAWFPFPIEDAPRISLAHSPREAILTLMSPHPDRSGVEPDAGSEPPMAAAGPSYHVPEPGSIILIVTGAIGLIARRRLQRRLLTLE